MKKRVLLTLAMLAAVAGCELGGIAMWAAKSATGGFLGTLGGSLSTLLLQPNLTVNNPVQNTTIATDVNGRNFVRTAAGLAF